MSAATEDQPVEIELDVGTTVEAEKDFRLQCKKILLTYRTHLPKEYLERYITNVMGFKPQFFRAAHETADPNNPYEHTHCLINFGRAVDKKKAQKLFDYWEFGIEERIHPNINLIKTNDHWENALKYLAKEDPENADLQGERGHLADRIWAQADIQDALRMAKKPGEVNGIETLWKHRPYTIPPLEYRLNTWQDELFTRLQNPDFRKIEWWWEPDGNVGKSTFVKYMLRNFPEKATFFDSLSYKDVSYAMVELFGKQQWKGNTIIVDLGRDYQEWDTFYRTLEMMKNGFAKSSKYAGGWFMVDWPLNIIVFANFLPDLNKMSLDRWNIRRILRSEVTTEH